ncbi:MAG: hypothetical protein ACP5IF_07660, partial [Conexivisphaera sp.]
VAAAITAKGREVISSVISKAGEMGLFVGYRAGVRRARARGLVSGAAGAGLRSVPISKST